MGRREGPLPVSLRVPRDGEANFQKILAKIFKRLWLFFNDDLIKSLTEKIQNNSKINLLNV